MKLSELIEYLQRGLLEHGNVEVFEADYWHCSKGLMYTEVKANEKDYLFTFTHRSEDGSVDSSQKVNALCVSDSLV